MVGAGLVGGSIGMRLRQAGWHVTGRDLDDDRAKRALELGALDAVGDDRTATVTFVATPVRTIADEARRALAAGPGLVTDVGSVKASIVEAVADPRFVGGHPMAGSEQEGVEGATADLFEGATWVLTPTTGTDAGAYAQVRQIIGTLGAEVVALPPDRHDVLVAVVSHVPHLTAATLMRLADDRSEEHRALLRLAAGGFRDMTRIAAGHPGIWPDICSDNRAAIVDVLDELTAALGRMREIVAGDDRTGLLDALEQRPGRPGQPAGPLPHRRGPARAAGPGARPARRAGRRDHPRHRPRREHRRPRDRPLDRGGAGRADPVGRGLGGGGAAPRPGGPGLPAVGASPRTPGAMSSSSGPGVPAVEPIEGPLDATVTLPGSKSLTNRALLCAALADGVSAIDGALRADDTEAMASALRALGARIAPGPNGGREEAPAPPPASP